MAAPFLAAALLFFLVFVFSDSLPAKMPAAVIRIIGSGMGKSLTRKLRVHSWDYFRQKMSIDLWPQRLRNQTRKEVRPEIGPERHSGWAAGPDCFRAVIRTKTIRSEPAVSSIFAVRHPDYIRGWGYQDEAIRGMSPTHAFHRNGFGADFKKSVREDWP